MHSLKCTVAHCSSTHRSKLVLKGRSYTIKVVKQSRTNSISGRIELHSKRFRLERREAPPAVYLHFPVWVKHTGSVVSLYKYINIFIFGSAEVPALTDEYTTSGSAGYSVTQHRVQIHSLDFYL